MILARGLYWHDICNGHIMTDIRKHIFCRNKSISTFVISIWSVLILVESFFWNITFQLNDETCLKLKKQVYLNYKQFIEAAREISQLESEMFKINHILTEQKTIMDNITKLFSEETFQEAEKRNQKSIDNENIKHKALTSLVGRVEGSLGDLHSQK